MTTIEIDVPAKLADNAEDLRGAISELLEYTSRNPAGLSAVAGLLETLTVREGVLRHITDTVANQPVPIGPGTAGQIALVDQRWRCIESRYGVLDAGQYAQLVGASPTSRSVASKAKAKGLVGYRRGRRLLYPGFQFDERGLRAGWNEIVAPLRDTGWDDEDIILWLAAPNGRLGGRSPVEALDQGHRELVLGLVENETAGVW
ncbi:MAG: Rv2175c family DNA-binding protein [Nocardioides sp.]|uniref:Rv2175c family DNA-binding protein n=1 Tax=Nocardioides sp. TaxID=35761 RepID=UPI0039E2B3DA